VGIEFFSRWKEFQLGEVLEIKYGKDHKHLNDGNIPVYGSGGIMRFGDKAIYDKKSILIPRKGSLNNIFYKEEPFWTVDTMFWTKINEEKVYPKFLFYQLTTVDYTNLNVGSAVPSLTVPVIEEIDVFLPPIEEQKAIATFLGSFDDKIDLLHRQNKTLEELAETLFRSYFQMTNEENNYIELGNYVECINGVSYKSSELNTSKVGMVSLKSFDRNGGFRIDGFKEFTGKFKEKQVVVEGDLIVAHTDITQDAEVIGNPALVIDNPNFETMTISMDIVKVISKEDWISNEFLYFLMKTREFKSHCEGCANGSTVLHLNKQAIPTFEFPEPDKNKISDFTNQAKEIVNKIFLNHRQLRILVKTRDTLLPKLMSGEVRISL
jgi:type I restriction enzyme S subunit